MEHSFFIGIKMANLNLAGKHALPAKLPIAAGCQYIKTCNPLRVEMHLMLLVDYVPMNRIIIAYQYAFLGGRFSSYVKNALLQAEEDTEIELSCGCKIRKLTSEDLEQLNEMKFELRRESPDSYLKFDWLEDEEEDESEEEELHISF